MNKHYVSLKANTNNDFFFLLKSPPKNPVSHKQVSPALWRSSCSSWSICFLQTFHMVFDDLLTTSSWDLTIC